MYIIDFMQERIYRISDDEYKDIYDYLMRWDNRYSFVSDGEFEEKLEVVPWVRNCYDDKDNLIERANEWRERKF